MPETPARGRTRDRSEPGHTGQSAAPGRTGRSAAPGRIGASPTPDRTGGSPEPERTGGRREQGRRAGGRWIEEWDPEDERFWNAQGERIAHRNLWISVLCEHIGFSVWTFWSVLVLFMGPEYGIDPAGKFFLASTSTLVGSVVRVPYTFAVARFGGRNWTVISASLLLLPLVAAFVVTTPGTPYWAFLLCAALSGLGGGNFASSMTNVNSYFPLRLKGWALGLNAGGGNLGVPVVQLAGLAVIGAAGGPRLLLGIYLPAVLVAMGSAFRYMDNLRAVRNDTGAVREAVRDPHTWLMALLYVGTFGSFIGYSFAFGLVLQTQFGRTPLEAASVTFVGPLLGSLVRPIGGRLADRYGGARITLWNFVAMAAATALVALASVRASLPLFTGAFIALFALSGLGNGATYRMIPAIFRARATARGMTGQAAAAYGRRLSGAAMGLIGAVGALGGLGINLALRQSFQTGSTGTAAFLAFLGCYAVCFGVTRAVYLRRSAGGGATVPVAAGTQGRWPDRTRV